MNSKYVVSQHSQTYKRLYVHNDVVVSAPWSVELLGGDNRFYQDQISQPIPLRLHIGVKKNYSQEIILDRVEEYDFTSNTFIDNQTEIWSAHDIGVIQNIVGNQGVSINIISQVPFHYGLGSKDFMLELMAKACKLLIGELRCSDFPKQKPILQLPLDMAIVYSGVPQLPLDREVDEESNLGLVLPVMYERLAETYKNLAGMNTPEIVQFLKTIHLISSLLAESEAVKTYSDLLSQELSVLFANVIHCLITNNYIGSGGCYLVLAPLYYLRPKVAQISVVGGKYNGALMYYSGSDGFDSGTAMVEHFPRQSINHALTNSCTIKVQDNQNATTMYDSLEQSMCNYDILVDSRHGKLFVGGQKLSSLDISSQQYTAYVLERHVHYRTHSMTSDALPISSYSKSKSEFMGKIVNPFQRLIQQKIGKPFAMSCKGQGSSFTIDLSYEDISIGCIS